MELDIGHISQSLTASSQNQVYPIFFPLYHIFSLFLTTLYRQFPPLKFLYFITLLKYNYTSLLNCPFPFSTVSTQGSQVVNDSDGGEGEGGGVASGIKRPLGK